MRASNVLAFLFISLFLCACSHPIEIVGQGDVTSASGNRNCRILGTHLVSVSDSFSLGQ